MSQAIKFKGVRQVSRSIYEMAKKVGILNGFIWFVHNAKDNEDSTYFDIYINDSPMPYATSSGGEDLKELREKLEALIIEFNEKNTSIEQELLKIWDAIHVIEGGIGKADLEPITTSEINEIFNKN